MRVGILAVPRLISTLVAAATVAACGGGDDSGTEPTPAMSIALSSSALNITQGTTGTATVNLTRSGGFTGDAAITVEGLPGTVTYVAAPATIGGSASSAVIALDVGGSATPGVINATVRATGTGVSAATAPLAITVVAAPTYTLAVANAAVTATQGGTATQTINITRTGGFAGAVALTAEGLPTGVTAGFDPQTATGNSSTLTLTAAANAATGSATVTVKGTASGQADKTATFLLTVSASASDNFTLAVNPATLTIQQGTGGTSTVTITRRGFVLDVVLTVTGLPNGVTAVFGPEVPATRSSTLTLTASATAATGPATVTIHGRSRQIVDRRTTLALTVNPAVGGSGNTSLEFCTMDQTPIWFAFQDGANGAWARVNPSASGTKFQFNITQAKAGVAYVTTTASAGVASASRSLAVRLVGHLQREMLLRNRPMRASYTYTAQSLATGYSLTILYGSQAELNGRGANLCLPGSGKTVNGTVAGVNSAQAQSASISLGPSTTSAAPAGTFQLRDVPDGALDLVSVKETYDETTLNTSVDKMIIRRGVNAGNNSTLPVLDFRSAEAFDPVQRNLTIGNLGTDFVQAFTNYFTAAGSGAAGVRVGASPQSLSPFTYYGVPASKQIAGDLHLVLAIAFPTTGVGERIAALYFKDPTDRTVTLGAVLPAQTVSAAATAPYVRFRATGSIPAEYGKLLDLEFTQSSAARSVTILASESYLAGAANYEITVPDFSGVAGWDNNWGPKTGSETEWRVSTFGFTGIGLGSLNPVDGATFKGAGRSGIITP